MQSKNDSGTGKLKPRSFSKPGLSWPTYRRVVALVEEAEATLSEGPHVQPTSLGRTRRDKL